MGAGLAEAAETLVTLVDPRFIFLLLEGPDPSEVCFFLGGIVGSIGVVGQ
jgi:hypothetical protein